MLSKRKFSLNNFSKYRGAIYGFSILWIVIFHGFAMLNIDYSLGKSFLKSFALVIEHGNVGCDIFLILSGISLYFSFKKDSDFYSFIKKRLVKLVLPVWLIDGAYWFYRYIAVEHSGLSTFINRMLLFHFWEKGDTTIWFISTILVMYLLYPYINRFLFAKDDNKTPIVRGIILLLISYIAIYCFARVNAPLYAKLAVGVTRFPAFIFGCIAGKYVYEEKEISSLWLIPMLVLAVLFFYILGLNTLHGYRMRFFYIVGGISLTFILGYFFNILNKYFSNSRLTKFFAFFGKFSLELYVSHVMINQLYQLMSFYKPGGIKVYILLVMLAIAIAWVVSKIDEQLKKRILSIS